MKNVKVWKEDFHALRSVAFLDVKTALASLRLDYLCRALLISAQAHGMSSDAIIPELLEREEKQPESLLQDFGGAVSAGDVPSCIP